MAIVANEIFATLHCNQFIHSCSEMKSVDTLSNKENMNPMLILKQIEVLLMEYINDSLKLKIIMNK